MESSGRWSGDVSAWDHIDDARRLLDMSFKADQVTGVFAVRDLDFFLRRKRREMTMATRKRAATEPAIMPPRRGPLLLDEGEEMEDDVAGDEEIDDGMFGMIAVCVVAAWV